MIKKKTESGQILYLIVIAIISLVGFAGLAIDGGRIYSEKRSAQNVADTTAFTAALVIGQTVLDNPMILSEDLIEDAEFAGYNRAASNGYGETDPNVDFLTIDITGPFTDDGIYYLVTVELGAHIEATFIGIVYNGPLAVEVRAVAKVRPIQDLGFGHAMLGVNKHACDAVWVGGSGEMDLTGSGLFSNSDGNNGSCDGLYQGGASSLHVEGGGISSVGTVTTKTCTDENGPIWPCAEEGATQVDVELLTPPVCNPDPDYDFGALQINHTSGLEYHVTPGNYTSIKINGGVVVFDPGLYCVDNYFRINGGMVTGNRVLFYMKSGEVIFSANADIIFSAADNLKDFASPPVVWDGMVIFMDPSNTSDVTLTGNAQTGFSGTVYAPSSLCDIIGNEDNVSVGAQFICDTIKLTGNGTIDLSFDESKVYLIPSSIDLDE